MSALTDRPCTCHAEGLRPAELASPARATSPPNPVNHHHLGDGCLHGGEHRTGAAAVLRLAAELLASVPDRFNFSATAGGYEVVVRPAGQGSCQGDVGDRPPPAPAPPAAPTAVTHATGQVASPPAAGAPDLARHFISAHERFILLELAAHPAGCRAADVREACRVEVESSRFWALWANLQHRGIVADAPKGGFQLAGRWVSELLSGA